MTIQRVDSNQRMSQIVTYANTVYLAGQTAENTEQGIAEQTAETLQTIEQLLARAGSDKEHILSVTIYLKDIERDFAVMNAVWDRWLPVGITPARATVEARMCEPDILVEMSVIAAINSRSARLER